MRFRPGGGRLSCHVQDDRVELAGQAVTFAVGEIVAPNQRAAFRKLQIRFHIAASPGN